MRPYSGRSLLPSLIPPFCSRSRPLGLVGPPFLFLKGASDERPSQKTVLTYIVLRTVLGFAPWRHLCLFDTAGSRNHRLGRVSVVESFKSRHLPYSALWMASLSCWSHRPLCADPDLVPQKRPVQEVDKDTKRNNRNNTPPKRHGETGRRSLTRHDSAGESGSDYYGNTTPASPRQPSRSRPCDVFKVQPRLALGSKLSAALIPTAHLSRAFPCASPVWYSPMDEESDGSPRRSLFPLVQVVHSTSPSRPPLAAMTGALPDTDGGTRPKTPPRAARRAGAVGGIESKAGRGSGQVLAMRRRGTPGMVPRGSSWSADAENEA